MSNPPDSELFKVKNSVFLCIPRARPHAVHKRRALYRPSFSSRQWKVFIFFLKILLAIPWDFDMLSTYFMPGTLMMLSSLVLIMALELGIETISIIPHLDYGKSLFLEEHWVLSHLIPNFCPSHLQDMHRAARMILLKSCHCSAQNSSMALHFTQHKIQILTRFCNALHYLPKPQTANLMTSCPTTLPLAVSGKPHRLPDICLKHWCVYSCLRPFLAALCAYRALSWSLHGLLPCLFQVLFKCHCIRKAFLDSPVVTLKYAHKISDTPPFER